MDTLNTITTVFAQADIELSRDIESILLKKSQITINSLITACKDSPTIRQRLVNNSRLKGDTVIILALKYNCEELFRCIVEILAKEDAMPMQLNKEVFYTRFFCTRKFEWIAKFDEREIKWVMRQAIEVPVHCDLLLKAIIREMSKLGRNMNMFCTGYNPIAHAIQTNNHRIYRRLIQSEIGHLRVLNGEPVLFHAVKRMTFTHMTSKVKERMDAWEYEISQESLLESQVYGSNLLTRAIENLDFPLVAYLIERHRLTINQLSSRELPLSIAVKTNSTEMVRRLLEANFSAVEQDRSGLTPLQVAFYSKCVRMTEMLLETINDMYIHWQDIYTLDNLCRAMSAERWWLAKDIFEGIQARQMLKEVFGEGMSHKAIELQIDIMTARLMLRDGIRTNRMQRPFEVALLQAKSGWCQQNTPRVLETGGRDWWGTACHRIHYDPVITN